MKNGTDEVFVLQYVSELGNKIRGKWRFYEN